MTDAASDPRIARARQLRRNAVVPERLLWGKLRNRRLAGLKFRRQHPVGPFVIDFYCASANLAIEVDGNSHADRGRYDRQRENYLRGKGLRVLRIDNDDVLGDIDSVLCGILQACGIDPYSGERKVASSH